MNLPKVVEAVLKAQADFDSEAYALCFAETAIVFDEGQTHRGYDEIRQWNEDTNAQYQTMLTPLDFIPADNGGTLGVSVSGVFPGSPIVLKYHFETEGDKILSLKISA